MKQIVSSNSSVISTRQTCGQRLGMAAGSKRRALGFYFPVRICHMFLISKCSEESDLGLCMTSVLAKRMPLRSFKIARDVVNVLIIYVDIYHFNHTFSHEHIEAHIMWHKHTCMISAQEEWREPGTEAWSGGAGKCFVRDTGLAHTHTHQKKWQQTEITSLKRLKPTELPAKLLDYF